MGSYKKVGLLAGAASVAIGGMAFGEITPNDRDARITALEQEIAAIKSDSNWLTGDRTEANRALLQEVLADSDSRSSLMGNGGGAGWNNGFYLASQDGSFNMTIGGQVQFRHLVNSRDGTGLDNDNNEFELRRTRLWFQGSLFDGTVDYKVMGNFNRDGGLFELLDAWGHWNMDNGWGFKWGQFKAPLMHEELVSSKKQLAVDRSYVNGLVTTGYTQGVAFDIDNDDNFRFVVSYNDGAGRLNTAFDSVPTASNEWALTGRVEYKGAGGWDQFKDFSSLNTSEFGWMVGAAANWQSSEYGTMADFETETFTWTVDGSFEGDQWNAAAWIVGNHIDVNDGTDEIDQFGFVVQGGVFLAPDKFEIFGRWEWYDFDNAAMADDSINIVTFGANYYIDSNGHAWKWTNDVVWALDEIPFSNTGVGLMADASGQDDQIVMRSQIQFLF